MHRYYRLRAYALTLAVAAVTISAVGVSTSAIAQEMPSPEKLNDKISAIKAKYQPQIDALKAEGEEATKDLPSREETLTGISLGKMKHYDWYVKVPEFVMRQQTWFVRIPEIKMGLQRIVWHMPEPCMQYRPFPWGGGMHVPGICMREKDWRFHVPEIAMREQKWILDIPEVTMKEQHWSFDFPEIRVEASKKRVDRAQERAEAVGQRGEQLAAAMGGEIKTAVRDYLLEARVALTAQFDPQIAIIKSQLGVVPEQAKAELSRNLAEVEKARAEALKEIDDQLAAVS